MTREARGPLLITGASGRVGSALRAHLRNRYRLRLFDLVEPAEPPGPREELVVGNLNDPDDLAAAVEGVGGVLHLACVHGPEKDFEATLDVNYRAHLSLLEEAVRRGVERFVYASSHHVMGLYPSNGPQAGVLAGAAMAPDAFYGLSKGFGELACAMYTHRCDMRTLVVRIGNADPTVRDARTLRIWVSSRDLAQLVVLGLTHPELKYEIVYGVSNCPNPLFENGRARQLGYEPLDNALDHLDPEFTAYEAMPEDAGRDLVGGAYAASQLPTVRGHR